LGDQLGYVSLVSLWNSFYTWPKQTEHKKQAKVPDPYLLWTKYFFNPRKFIFGSPSSESDEYEGWDSVMKVRVLMMTLVTL
jgi:hypothetical protein